MEEPMITLHFTQQDIDELNYQRFHHPDPMVLKRCDTVYLKAKGLNTGQIHDLTGRDVKTIRSHLHLYKDGGIEALKQRKPYRPQSELASHQQSIEDEFRQRPAASIKEAGERIFQLLGIRRGDTQVETFLKRSGFKFRKAGGIPAKANLAAQEEFLKKS
jgi:transposase